MRFLRNRLDPADPALTDFFRKRGNVTRAIVLNLEAILTNCPARNSTTDYDIYCGSAGIALLCYHLYCLNPTFTIATIPIATYCLSYLHAALSALPAPPRRSHAPPTHPVYTGFLGSPVGPLALATVVAHKVSNDQNAAKEYLSKILSRYHPSAVNAVGRNSMSSNELLYGRAGYLYALLFVKTHCGGSEVGAMVSDELVRQVFDAILSDGKDYAQIFKTVRALKDEEAPPLMWCWHETEYLGAIHGAAGIVTILLQFRALAEPHLDDLLRVLEFVVGLAFPSGNFPSSMSALERDELVHFCHGAPGVIPALTLAYDLYPSERTRRLLQAAERAAECVWERGLLKKGVGLCHGISGNAFAFLALHRSHTLHPDSAASTHQDLGRAQAFASFAMDWKRDTESGDLRLPDNPYSLFEGVGGAVWLWAELWGLSGEGDERGSGVEGGGIGRMMGGFPCFTDLV